MTGNEPVLLWEHAYTIFRGLIKGGTAPHSSWKVPILKLLSDSKVYSDHNQRLLLEYDKSTTTALQITVH